MARINAAMAASLTQRSSLEDTFSSWDNCMEATYCKWPVIAICIVGGLILISIIWCIARRACCGRACCCSCFSCFKCCGDCCGCCTEPGERKHKHLDEPYSSTPPATAPINQGYQAPQTMGYTDPAAEPPKFSQFETKKPGVAVDSPKSAVGNDALPTMPSWDGAAKKVMNDEEAMHAKEEGVELGQLNQHGQSMPLKNGQSPAVSPMDGQAQGGYITGGQARLLVDKYGRPQNGGNSPVNQYGRPQNGGNSPIDQYGRPHNGGNSPVDQYGRPQNGGNSPVDQYGRGQPYGNDRGFGGQGRGQNFNNSHGQSPQGQYPPNGGFAGAGRGPPGPGGRPYGPGGPARINTNSPGPNGFDPPARNFTGSPANNGPQRQMNSSPGPNGFGPPPRTLTGGSDRNYGPPQRQMTSSPMNSNPNSPFPDPQRSYTGESYRNMPPTSPSSPLSNNPGNFSYPQQALNFSRPSPPQTQASLSSSPPSYASRPPPPSLNPGGYRGMSPPPQGPVRNPSPGISQYQAMPVSMSTLASEERRASGGVAYPGYKSYSPVPAPQAPTPVEEGLPSALMPGGRGGGGGNAY